MLECSRCEALPPRYMVERSEQNPDKNAGKHFCTAVGCPQGEPQEAASDLISGGNSAAALLERIKAEREVNGKIKRKAKA